MNHKRKRTKHTRPSSDYVYMTLEKGHHTRGRFSVKRWMEKANYQLKEYLGKAYHAR